MLDSSADVCLAGASTGTRKLDRDGNQLWTVPVNGSVLKGDAAGNLYVSAPAYAGPTTKLDGSGGRIWTAPFGGRMFLDPAGSLFLASSMLNNSSWDYATVKVDQQQGNLVWQAINNSFGGGEENPTALGLHSSGNVYVTGRVNGMLGTLRYDLDGNRVWQTQYPAGSSPLLGRLGRERLAWMLAVVPLAAAVAALAFLRADAPIQPLVQSSLLPPPGWDFAPAPPFAVSPDGSQIVYVAIARPDNESTAAGSNSTWIHDLASPEPRRLAGTDGDAYPFWSANGRWLGFFANGKLNKIEARGGPVIPLCDATDGRGGTWNADGIILFQRAWSKD